MKKAICEIQNLQDVTTTKMEEAEKRISDMEDRIMEINEAEDKKERKLSIMKLDLGNSRTPSNIVTFVS